MIFLPPITDLESVENKKNIFFRYFFTEKKNEIIKFSQDFGASYVPYVIHRFYSFCRK